MEEPRRLGGRYELGAVLGRGGMAEVYVAQDTRLGRTVAVKTLRVDLARDPSFQARFRREAQSAASLNHPAIVAVYDTGEDYVDGVSIPYIVMEYVDGSTLRELLHSGRKLLPERAMEMCVGILQALQYSHQSGIVHRDIKPANVMLTRNGQVKVMDFGIARAMGESGITMTQTAAVIGTAQYLSPEQAKGESVDARSDLYSTGCLLYELLTVRPPFVGDSPVAVAYQHVREEPQPPSSFDPEVSPEMDAIVLRALVKDPDYRYQSADEMRADIEACLDGQPVAATSAMGAVGYGYPNDHSGGAAQPQGSGGQTTMLPPVRDDDYGFTGDQGGGRRRQPKKSNLSIILWVIAAIFVLVGAIFMGRALFGDGKDGDPEVPQLKGLSYQEAEQRASNVNLKVARKDSTYCGEKARVICSTDPAAGTKLAEGETIQLTMSKGAKPVDVPSVVDSSFSDAKEELEGAGFKVKKKTEESDKDPDTVLRQDPAGESKAKKGATVTLTVAIKQTINVPSVVGKPYEDAKADLEKLGFEVARKDEENPSKPAGEVLKQNPEANTRHPGGTQITLTVAKEEESEDEPATVPDVTNKPLSEAKKMLTDAGFKVGRIVGAQGPTIPVSSTDPAANTEAKKGDSVEIRTRLGPGDQNTGGLFGGVIN
ncbi:Stk1 family PASTA domain-containing Ser/Thr kinase [Streptomyces sp. NPDC005438]|uniref:Stk1 family PASTA domain-containing Ser/Thr kinase n=1 Tax=Streptomyces sp. NPDC005438 TaxID=3156880 RepID=UPI0033BBCC98